MGKTGTDLVPQPKIPYEREDMKKLLVISLIAVFPLIAGCLASIRNSEWAQHRSQYKNWDHMKFSIWGYRNPTEETMRKSMEQEWWGEEIPYIPAE